MEVVGSEFRPENSARPRCGCAATL